MRFLFFENHLKRKKIFINQAILPKVAKILFSSWEEMPSTYLSILQEILKIHRSNLVEIPRGHLANRLEILKMHLSPLQQIPQDQFSNQLVIHQIHVSNSKVDSAGEVGFDIGQCALFAKVDILVAIVMIFGASVAGA